MNRFTKFLLVGVAALTASLIAAAPLTAGEPNGAELWKDKRAKCVMCHGADGKGQSAMGKKAGAPNMASEGWQKGITDQKILDAVLKGFEREKDGKTFKHKGLQDGTEAEGKALLKHIRGFAPGKGGDKGGDKGGEKK